jgi:hypothetical protein
MVGHDVRLGDELLRRFSKSLPTRQKTDLRKIGSSFGTVCGVIVFGTLEGPPTGRYPGCEWGGYLWVQLWVGTVEILAVGVLVVGSGLLLGDYGLLSCLCAWHAW